MGSQVIGGSRRQVKMNEPARCWRTCCRYSLDLLDRFIFCVKQNSKFVKFHALRSLVWQLCYMGLIFCGSIAFAFATFTMIAHNPAGTHRDARPPMYILFFPLLWLVMMRGWLVNAILGIVYGLKANRGEWAAYPVIGKWLRPKEVAETSQEIR